MKRMFGAGIITGLLAFAGCGHDGPDYCEYHQDVTLRSAEAGTYALSVTVDGKNREPISLGGGRYVPFKIPLANAVQPMPATKVCLTFSGYEAGAQLPMTVNFDAWPPMGWTYDKAVFGKIGDTHCLALTQKELSELHISCYKYGGLPYYMLEKQ